MKARLYQEEFIVCPHCDKLSGNRVDHLYHDKLPRSFGPWHCDECGEAYEGIVRAPSDVEVEKSQTREKFWPGYSLLKIDSTEGPIFFVMKNSTMPERDPESLQDSQRYFYEEHSCPTNWIGDCVAVIEDGDTDPHGFMEFVRHVTVPDDFDEDRADWQMLFPEAFGIVDHEGSKAHLMLVKE